MHCRTRLQEKATLRLWNLEDREVDTLVWLLHQHDSEQFRQLASDLRCVFQEAVGGEDTLTADIRRDAEAVPVVLERPLVVAEPPLRLRQKVSSSEPAPLPAPEQPLIPVAGRQRATHRSVHRSEPEFLTACPPYRAPARRSFARARRVGLLLAAASTAAMIPWSFPALPDRPPPSVTSRVELETASTKQRPGHDSDRMAQTSAITDSDPAMDPVASLKRAKHADPHTKEIRNSARILD